MKKLLKRRVPHILGSYIVAATSLVLFIEYLVDKYQFPPHYPVITLFGILAIIPSVIILAYFHGAPGKDEWTKIEKIGIPVNIIFIAAMLLVGYQKNLWVIDERVEEEKPVKYLIYFTSLYDDIEMYEETKILSGLIQGRKLDTLNYSLIDSISKNIMTLLLSEYYNSKKEFIIPTSYADLEYLNKHSLTIGDWGTSLPEADSIYNRFDRPNKIYYINLYKFIQDDLNNNQDKYFYGFFNLHCLPSKDCINDNVGLADVDIDKELFLDLRSIISKSKKIGTVSHSKEDIVSVKLNDMNIREDMILDVAARYDFSLDGREIIKSDLNSAIKHYEALNNTNILAGLNEKLSWFSDSLKHPYGNKTASTSPFFYKVRVIEVVDSTAITKIYSKEPFVKIRKGDVVSIR